MIKIPPSPPFNQILTKSTIECLLNQISCSTFLIFICSYMFVKNHIYFTIFSPFYPLIFPFFRINYLHKESTFNRCFSCYTDNVSKNRCSFSFISCVTCVYVDNVVLGSL
nr:MAG TPA: hypothetical protein [Caudoviricetes sp.]